MDEYDESLLDEVERQLDQLCRFSLNAALGMSRIIPERNQGLLNGSTDPGDISVISEIQVKNVVDQEMGLTFVEVCHKKLIEKGERLLALILCHFKAFNKLSPTKEQLSSTLSRITLVHVFLEGDKSPSSKSNIWVIDNREKEIIGMCSKWLGRVHPKINQRRFIERISGDVDGVEKNRSVKTLSIPINYREIRSLFKSQDTNLMVPVTASFLLSVNLTETLLMFEQTNRPWQTFESHDIYVRYFTDYYKDSIEPYLNDHDLFMGEMSLMLNEKFKAPSDFNEDNFHLMANWIFNMVNAEYKEIPKDEFYFFIIDLYENLPLTSFTPFTPVQYEELAEFLRLRPDCGIFVYLCIRFFVIMLKMENTEDIDKAIVTRIKTRDILYQECQDDMGYFFDIPGFFKEETDDGLTSPAARRKLLI